MWSSKFLGKFFSQILDIVVPWEGRPKTHRSARPATSHNTILPVPQNLSVFGHVFPWGSNPTEIQLKSRNRFQDSTSGNSLAL